MTLIELDARGVIPLTEIALAHSTDRRMKLGFWIIAVAFGGGFIAAALTPLNGAAVAPGVVSADTRNKTVQHLEGGIIKEILVAEGSQVEGGQPLIRLDDTQAQASFRLVRGKLSADLALEARLLAERDGENQITFPDELLADREGPAVTNAIKGQQSLFEARHNDIEGQTGILQQRIKQLQEEITGLGAQQEATDKQLHLIHEEEDTTRFLVDNNLATKPRLLALERGQQELEGRRGDLIAQAAKARQHIGEAQMQVAQLSIDQKSSVVDDLRDVESEIFDLRQRALVAANTLDRLTLRAPQPGTVVKLLYHTIGGVIQPGQPILEFLPSDDKLIVEARVRPEDIDGVQVGLPAEIRINAFNQRRTPLILGKVIYVSADRLTAERPSDAPYYQARIEVDLGSLAKRPHTKLYAGMGAEVYIQTEARTALDYLLTPISTTFERAFREK
ncbi:MAG: lssD 3 [Rhodospirillales bacterium]|nr:lssD 3 [Rhodospirillales bacterium]